MKALSRRKKPDSGGGGGNAPWLNTFADLMNLLLCFFVMLFAYSDVSEDKFQQLSISMSNSIGVFQASSSQFGKGQLITSGMVQINGLDEMYNKFGKFSSGSTTIELSPYDSDTVKNNESYDDILTGNEGVLGENPVDGAVGPAGTGKTDSVDKEIGLDEALERLQEEMKKQTSDMYDKLSDLRDLYNLTGDTELKMDPQYQFVQLELKGSILYDSGSAQIRKEAEAILNKIGKLLKKFEGYEIEIVGHTDNVPVTSGNFKDNNWLSTARALNAAQYLIDNCDLDPAFLKYSGRGEYEPVSSNATSEGRARNRRIEIKIYNKFSSR